MYRVQVAIADDADGDIIRSKLQEFLNREQVDWFGAEITRYGRPNPRPCKNCGDMVMGRRSDAKFCSNRCRVAWFNFHAKEAPVA